MYFVLEGEARLRRGHVDLGTIGPGGHFGELALVGRRLRGASVASTSKLVLGRLSRARYDALSAEEPALALRFTRALAAAIGARLADVTESVGLLLRERSLPRRIEVDVTVGGALRRVKTGTKLRALLPEEVDGAPVVAALFGHKAVSARHAGDERGPDRAAHHRPLGGQAHLPAEPRPAPARGGGARRPEGRDAPRALHGLRAAGEPRGRRGGGGLFARGVGGARARSHEDARRDRRALPAGALDGGRGAEPLRREGLATTPSLLLRTVRESAVLLVTCGAVYALAPGPMVPSTGVLGRFPFRLEVAERGFLLRYGDEAEDGPSEDAVPPAPPPSSRAPGRDGAPPRSTPPPLIPRRSDGVDELWLGALGITSVGAFNQACVVGSVPQIIRVCEGLHEKRHRPDRRHHRRRAAARCGSSASPAPRRRARPRSSSGSPCSSRWTASTPSRSRSTTTTSTARRRRATPTGEYDFEAFEALDARLLQRPPRPPPRGRGGEDRALRLRHGALAPRRRPHDRARPRGRAAARGHPRAEPAPARGRDPARAGLPHLHPADDRAALRRAHPRERLGPPPAPPHRARPPHARRLRRATTSCAGPASARASGGTSSPSSARRTRSSTRRSSTSRA